MNQNTDMKIWTLADDGFDTWGGYDDKSLTILEYPQAIAEWMDGADKAVRTTFCDLESRWEQVGVATIPVYRLRPEAAARIECYEELSGEEAPADIDLRYEDERPAYDATLDLFAGDEVA